jgi:Co/Zn/Cd efflux system component
MTAHVTVGREEVQDSVLKRIERHVRRLGIKHSTIQV